MFLFDRFDAADPRTDQDTDPVGIQFGNIQAGMLDSLIGGNDRILDELGQDARFLAVKVLEWIKGGDFSSDLRIKGARIEAGDLRDPAFSGLEALPELRCVEPHGGNTAHTSYDNASFVHFSIIIRPRHHAEAL